MKKSLLALCLTPLLLNVALPVQAGDATEELKALCAKIAPATQSESPRQFTLAEAIKLLDDEGFKIKKAGSNKAVIKSNGRTFVLYRFDDGDFQMYYGVTGIEVTPRDINEWNRDKRLSRAYLDNENDPVLESDLDMTEGATPDQLVHFVKLFIDTSAPAYRMFLLSK